ncbi:hypothetical protein D3C76_1837070 [compost metagenome]
MLNIGQASRSIAAEAPASKYFLPTLSEMYPVIGEQTVITPPPTIAAMNDADCGRCSTFTE